MSKRDITLYIVDIFIAIDKLDRYISNFNDGDHLLGDEVYWDASIRELEIIGEATKILLSSNLIDAKYRRIVDFRNQITHGYFGIDTKIVWHVLVEKIPQYKKDLIDIVRLHKIQIEDAVAYAKVEFKSQTQTVTMLNSLTETIKE